LLAEHVADGVSLIQDGKFLFVNHAFASMYGYTDPDELTGKDVTDLVLKEYKQSLMQIYEAVISGTTKEKHFQLKCISKRGREFWVEEHYNIIQWNDQPTILATVRDITRAKSQEIAIREDAERLKEAHNKLRATLKDRYRFGDIIGKSKPMQEIYELILESAASDGGVVIYGESGTGKELIAKTIHNLSVRHEMAFVPVNCGAIPESIFESEFFGHRKGAYTGADSDRRGLFDIANHGTLFLDEVGELTPHMQVKLLRAIEGGGYTPVGGNKARYSDIRIIAATNENLRSQIKTKKIREDFFFRIHIIPIYVPPLRDRREDIPLLLEHFLMPFSKDKKIPEIPAKTMEVLRGYDWPGNVRELQNVIQRYITTKNFNLVDTVGVREDIIERRNHEFINNIDFLQKEHDEGITDLRAAVADYEKSLIGKALDQAHWNRKEASKLLGIPLRTLSRKIKRCGPF
jgi:PAS domain S-box-containing protein